MADREAWTLGQDDLYKTVTIEGLGWSLTGELKKVDVSGSVLAAARNRFTARGTDHLAVVVWVGPFVGPVPARALLTVHEKELSASTRSLESST